MYTVLYIFIYLCSFPNEPHIHNDTHSFEMKHFGLLLLSISFICCIHFIIISIGISVYCSHVLSNNFFLFVKSWLLYTVSLFLCSNNKLLDFNSINFIPSKLQAQNPILSHVFLFSFDFKILDKRKLHLKLLIFESEGKRS